MPITKKELSQMLIDAFESLEEVVDSPSSFHFKGFNQDTVQQFLDEFIRMSQREDASLRMAAEYSHSNETIQVWFYYNDYHPQYCEDDSESVIGCGSDLSESEKEEEYSGEE